MEKPLNALLATYNPLELDVCSDAIKSAGYIVWIAQDGEKARSMMATRNFDLIVADNCLPGLSGLDLLHLVSINASQAPVLVICEDLRKGDAFKVEEEGAAAFLSKPFTVEQFKKVLDIAINRRNENIHPAFQSLDECVKSNFLSAVSHKFLSPLAVIKGNIEEIKKTISPDFPQLDSIDAIYRAADELHRLTKKVIDYSELSSEPINLQLESIQIKDVLIEIIMAMERIASKKHQRLQLRFEGRFQKILADKQRLAAAFKNILENSICYSPMDTFIFVNCRGLCKIGRQSSPVDGWIEVSIADQGPGIPKEEIPRIFDKFYQIDTYKTGQIEGLGLGLTSAKRIIKAHQGEIKVESEVGKGTVVTARLPLNLNWKVDI